MNDYEHSFYEDVNAKKALVPSSRKKKNGSKSTKVTLPSDRLTQKQWESKNGPVITMKLNKPMTYAELRDLPLDMQERYLACLVDAYGVNLTHLSEMLGTTRRALNQYVKRHMFTKVKLRKGTHKFTDQQQQEWKEFLMKRNDISEEEPIVEPSVEYVQERDMIEEPEESNDISEESVDEEDDFTETLNIFTDTLNINSIHLNFEGNLDISVISTFLKIAIGEKVHGELQISFRKTENIEEGAKRESDAV